MKSKVKILAVFLVIVIMGTLSGCTKSGQVSDNNSDSNSDSDLFPIRVITQTGFNEINVADDLGFFKDEGIKIEYTGVLGQGITEFQLIQQGINDAFTGSHPPTVAQARLAGLKVKAVAPGMIDDPKYPHVNYLVKDGSGINSLDDIADKKVSISSTAPCNDGYLIYYLQKHSVSGKPQFITLSTAGQQEQSLNQGLVDITTSHAPYAGKALAAGGVHSIGTSWDILHSPGAGLSVRGFTEDFIAQHPKQVQGFVNALYKARVWINAHPDEAIKIVAKYLKLEPSDLSLFKYDGDKNINPEYIKEWYSIAEDIGLWKHGDISEDDVYTNQFVPNDYDPN